jgi:hypothetical protein
MKCEDCLTVIEEYFDAELNEQESAKVAEHLTACGICNEVFQSLEQEQQLYVHYQRDVEISPGLWQGVQAGIRQAAVNQAEVQTGDFMGRLRRFFTETLRAPRFSPALAAMLVVIAVGATVLVMNYRNSTSNPTNVATNNQNVNQATPATNSNTNPQPNNGVIANGSDKVEPKSGPAVPQEKDMIAQPTPVRAPKAEAANQRQLAAGIQPKTTAEALLRDAEQKYIKAIAILQRDFEKRRSKLDPQLVARLEGSLASIDRTIAETRKAVRQNADDPIAVQYMLTAYAKKVEVLRDITTD